MTGHRPFRELTEDFTPERRARVAARKQELCAAMALGELRRARRLTQAELAKVLDVGQPAIAKLERRTDMYVSTLRSYIEALGGRLRVTAEFPEGEVSITTLSEIGEEERETTPGAE